MWIDSMDCRKRERELCIFSLDQLGSVRVHREKQRFRSGRPSLSHCRQPLCHGEPSPRPGLALAFMVRSREGEKSRGKTWCGRSWMPTTIPLNKSIHYPTSPTDSLTDRCACCLLRCEGMIPATPLQT